MKYDVIIDGERLFNQTSKESFKENEIKDSNEQDNSVRRKFSDYVKNTED